ncbi:dolichyl-P-Man:Man(5)GlcNAc(2)-PP-dolichol alpha-1,3-mannosyltransferase [Sporothrix bragantina]|uniref:Dol-P-Man:Man(5)GlcNAc(2)-PP-Dol alpha-1,3-mannosyltransferase n=1 Tax=Sporothrix bragantina TaxID=671064 RepID=A0ABP0B164_9PEZI
MAPPAPPKAASSRPVAPTPLYLQAVNFVLDILTGRSALSILVPFALFALDAVLCGLVIWKVPYTEIDWVAYMEQVGQFVAGERDYTQMAGGTGPLVYPAAHVYIYTVLYKVTDEGQNILLAQQIFAGVYLAALALAMACFWRAGTPPYVFPLLILSKRLHSIYMLRCFNDGIAALCLWAALFCFQRRHWSLGMLAYAWGLGTKMSLLLVLPAVGIVLLFGRGFHGALRLAIVLVQVQFAIALPFVLENARGYLGRAFELSRQFFFRWTVNWRFVGEDVFLSTPFALGLLGVHAALLVLFATTRWLRPAGVQSPVSLVSRVVMPVLNQFGSPFSASEEALLSTRAASPQFIMTTILTANLVGLLTARSLHYQFYAYLAWTTPYLLWRSGVHPVVQYGLWAAQEWAWNVFPSTPVSSGVVVAIMALTVGLVWWGATEEYVPVLPLEKSEEKKR